MKKKFLIFMLVFIMICPIFVACNQNNENGNNNENNNSNNANISPINISYMKDLSIDIGNSKAFGIKKASTSVSKKSNYSKLLLSASLLSDSSENSEKNYLYSTTEAYENGTVEYDDNIITKVTFKKNKSVQEDIYDSEGNLIDSNTTITQEEILAQINRLYVNEKYMFMQFVAEVGESGNYNYIDNDETKSEYLELRPNELIYDENGISEFDLKDYYSSALSQSFVVDMANGNIYKISNFNIALIYDIDIVKDSNDNYYKMTINNNSELVFTDIMPNKEVSINNVITDKYGYTYVANSHIVTKDFNNKLIYFIDTKYMISDTKEVYLMDYDLGSLMYHIDKSIVNGVEQPYNNTNIVSGLRNIKQNIYESSLIGYYKENRVYNGNSYAGGGIEFIENSLYYKTSVSTNIKWLNNNFLSSVLLLNLNNRLYYKIVDIESCLNNSIIVESSNFTKLSENSLEQYKNDYYIKVGANKVKITNVFAEQTLTGTKYYKLVKTDNKMELISLQDIEYSQNVYIFQPINK